MYLDEDGVLERLTALGNPERMNWLEERRKGLGGSDIGKVCGMSKWSGPFGVYCDKMGLKDSPPKNWFMVMGKLQEPLLADLYEIITGYPVETNRNDKLSVHPEHKWMRATLDGVCRENNRIVSFKTAGFRQEHRWGTPGTDEVPEEYMAQVIWEMHIEAALGNEYEAADILVLMNGNDPRIYTVWRDKEFESILFNEGQKFWNDHILGEVPPPPDGSDDADNMIAKMFKKNNGKMKQADEFGTMYAETYRELDEQEKEITKRKEEAKQMIMQLVGNDDGLFGEGFKVTWKNSSITNWEAICKEIAPPADIIAKHTQINWGDIAKEMKAAVAVIEKHKKPEGSRRFLIKFNKS